MATSAAATLCAAAPLARLRPPRPTPQPAPAPSTAAPCAAVLPRRRLGRLAAVLDRGSGSGGAGVLDRPDFETMGPGGGPQADDSGAKREGSGGRGLGGGSWRVLLLDSERHTEERVVQGITTVIPGADEAHAANCFHTSRSLGMAMVTSAQKEYAEMYCQLLWQRSLKVGLEPDTTTL